MLACVARLREAFDVANVTRLYPKIFWLYRVTDYQSGVCEIEVKDYAGRATRFLGPGLGFGSPSSQVWEADSCFSPGNLLSTPNAEIVFRLTS